MQRNSYSFVIAAFIQVVTISTLEANNTRRHSIAGTATVLSVRREGVFKRQAAPYSLAMRDSAAASKRASQVLPVMIEEVKKLKGA